MLSPPCCMLPLHTSPYLSLVIYRIVDFILSLSSSSFILSSSSSSFVVVVESSLLSSPLLPQLLLAIIANSFRMIVAFCRLLAYIRGDVRIGAHLPPHQRRWQHRCHSCRPHVGIAAGTVPTSSRCAALFFDMLRNSVYSVVPELMCN